MQGPCAEQHPEPASWLTFSTSHSILRAHGHSLHRRARHHQLRRVLPAAAAAAAAPLLAAPAGPLCMLRARVRNPLQSVLECGAAPGRDVARPVHPPVLFAYYHCYIVVPVHLAPPCEAFAGRPLLPHM